ncbi:hypothetical protein EK904_004641, partial [Melospiza melodia maxima]
MLELIEVNGTPGSQLSTPRSGKSPSPSPTSPGSLRKQRGQPVSSSSEPRGSVMVFIIQYTERKDVTSS